MDDADADADAAYDEEFEAASDNPSRRESASEHFLSLASESAPPTPLAPRNASPPSSPPRLSSGYASPIVRPPSRAKPPPPTTKPIRKTLDQASWTFSVRASRVRALRVPILPSSSSAASSEFAVPASGGFPIIRDLRVFAAVDKQPMQSRASRWKQEARVAEAARPLVVARRTSSPTTPAPSPGRRSGVLQEALWRNGDGELAWVLTMDRFRRLKAYSPRIKLFVFGIGANARAENVRALAEDSPKTHRESIVSLGWFFLDLRTPDLPARWFKLQNSPFGGEILVSTTFSPTDSVRDRRNETPSLAIPRLQVTRRREHSKSVDSSEYLRLGDGRGADVFLFTVFIRGATQLQRVLRSSVATAEEEQRALASGVWLSYSLFDVVVQTDVFYNLERAEFAPIRDSFRVLSTSHDVLAFMKTQGFLSIYLCTHDRVLANSDVAFDSLIEQGVFTSPASSGGEDIITIEGTFPFEASKEGGITASFSIERSDEQLIADEKAESGQVLQLAVNGDDDSKPKDDHPVSVFVTVSHVQLRADILKMYAGKEAIELEVLCGEQAVRCPIRLNAFTADCALGDCPDLLLELNCVGKRLSSLAVTCFSSATDHALASSSKDDEPLATLDTNESQFTLYRSGRRVGECVLRHKPKNEELEEEQPVNEPRSIPGVSHTYRVFIRLKALRDFETSRPIVISYTNPFTNHERVETPLISVMRTAETDIPEAYCLFELHRDEASMKEAMESPVVMDVALALPDGSRQSIGSIIFSLNFLHFSEEMFCCADSSCEAIFKTHQTASKHWVDTHSDSDRHRQDAEPTVHSLKRCSIYLPVMSTQKDARNTSNPSRRVGAVQVEAYFEDAGPMSDTQVRLAEEMRVSRSIHSHQRSVRFPAEDSTTTKPMAGRGDESLAPQEKNSDNERDITVNSTMLENPEPIDRAIGLDEIKAQLLSERNAWMQEQKTQQAQWKKRIAATEKVRMDELEEEWARREEERSAVLKTTQTEYQKLEHKLRVTLNEVETRERKLALAESALDRDQRMLREDTELLRKRLQSEQSHALSLAQKQIEALEKRAAELQSNLQTAETRALQVEADFAEYRKQQRKVPESKLREEIASLNGHVTELEKARQMEIRAREYAEVNVDKMTLQLEKMAKRVQAEKKKNESRVVDDLEKLRLKYIAREERYVLDGDREELRAIKKQLDDLRRVHVSGHPVHLDQLPQTAAKSHNPFRDLQVTTRQPEESPHSPNSAEFSSPSRHGERRHSWSTNDDTSATKKIAWRRTHHASDTLEDHELRRLERERDSLLASGVYDDESYLVRELERRIVLRHDQLTQR